MDMMRLYAILNEEYPKRYERVKKIIEAAIEG